MSSCILITGSNGGIGLAITEYLLENGIKNLACHFRASSSEIKGLLKKHDLDPGSHLFDAELTDEAQVKNMRLSIEKKCGPVSALVNVTGMSTNGMSWKLSLADFNNVIANNLTTAFLCSREFIPTMREQNWGRIINFSSIVGFTGVPGASHYCAAKAGLSGLTKSMALELANKNITVNALALGYFSVGLIDSVPTEIQSQIRARIPLGRFGAANEIGSMVKYLISKDASYMTGQVLHLNGGQY